MAVGTVRAIAVISSFIDGASYGEDTDDYSQLPTRMKGAQK
jgi:hypothetical protein